MRSIIVPHVLDLDPSERIIEHQIVIEFERSWSVLRLDSQALDLVEPGSDLSPKVLPLFRRKLKSRELDQVLIEWVCQPEDDLRHQRPRIRHFQSFFEFHIALLIGSSMARSGLS